jgi:hypothetical protein
MKRSMTLLSRLAHILLVLGLMILLVRTVYYGFSLLFAEQHPQQRPLEIVYNVAVRKPSLQEIVRGTPGLSSVLR